MSRSLSASSALSTSGSSLLKASSVGANTVYGPGPARSVSRPAALTAARNVARLFVRSAVTSSESVATGATLVSGVVSTTGSVASGSSNIVSGVVSTTSVVSEASSPESLFVVLSTSAPAATTTSATSTAHHHRRAGGAGSCHESSQSPSLGPLPFWPPPAAGPGLSCRAFAGAAGRCDCRASVSLGASGRPGRSTADQLGVGSTRSSGAVGAPGGRGRSRRNGVLLGDERWDRRIRHVIGMVIGTGVLNV